MGLDTVELVLAIEEEFGLTIDDKDAERLTTPGQVADYVMSRVRARTGDPCTSQAGFYRLRAALTTAFGIPRRELKPQTSLVAVMAGNTRRKWALLRKAVAADRFPKLQRTVPFLTLTVFLLPAAIVSPMAGADVPFSVVALAYALLAASANTVTANMGTVLPLRFQTVAALIPYVACASSKCWTREAALERIIQITSEQLGIQQENLSENSRFVQDLGAD